MAILAILPLTPVVLTLGVMLAYLGIVAGLSAPARDRLSAAPLIATGVVALAFAPARSAVQSTVDRVMYGQRRDPAVAAARVGLRLGTGLDGVMRAVCEALRLPYAAVSSDGRLGATYGRASGCATPTPSGAAPARPTRRRDHRVNGVEATRDILRAAPGTRVLVLTMFEDDESVFAAMRAGALGYLVKGALREEIVRAVRSVAAGHAVFGPSVARRIIDFFAGGASPARGRAPAPEPFPELTAREREVLDLIAAGRSNAAIARHLGISGKTVSNHITAIFAKLAVADRAEAIVRARRAGLGADIPTARVGPGPGSR